MPQSVEDKVINTIYRKGRGWVFSHKDLVQCGSRGAVDLALHRLAKKGIIQRVIRGLYNYPRYSEALGTEISPEIDQVAGALARKFGWNIQPSGPTALNLLGFSTQVPGRIVYLSNGPDRKYKVGSYEITIKHKALKESRFKLRESALIVQALKALGKQHITPEVAKRIRNLLDDPKLREKVMKDTKTATGWVYETIRKICGEET